MSNSQVALAAAEFAKGNYTKALDIYERLGLLMGERHFKANIQICRHRLSKIEGPPTMLDSAQARPTFVDQSIVRKPSELFKQILNDLRYRTTHKHKCIKNKIAYFLHNSLPYSSGGYATRAHGLALGLSEIGYNVICCTRPGFPIDTEGDHMGKTIPQHDKIDLLDYWRIFNPVKKNIPINQYMLEAAEAIKIFLSENNIQVAIAASNHHTAIPVGIAARQLGIPYIYEVRGFWEITRLSREPDYKKSSHFLDQVRNESEACINADAVLTLTQAMREEIINRGVESSKITILPNSCDPSRFTPRLRDLNLAQELSIPENVPVIGYIGSFVQYEGLENLAQACAILLNRGIDFRLLIVGNENASGSTRGPITEEIYRVAKTCGFGGKLIMPGRVPHEQVESFYSLIDIAPFPRKPQPVTEMVSPMKPLEALAMEKAVVVSSVKALREMVINNETGLIYEKGNIEDLASKIELLIKNKELRQRIGKNGRKWVEKERTWNIAAKTAHDVIVNILKNV